MHIMDYNMFYEALRICL